jgi:leader peptidase (prepilin peptidase)/N-methyltransferase
LAIAFKTLRGREGLGEGDPPLLGLIGAFLGWRALLPVLLWSSAIGLASALILRGLGRRDRPDPGQGRDAALPFAPFLVLAAYIQILFGQIFPACYRSPAG